MSKQTIAECFTDFSKYVCIPEVFNHCFETTKLDLASFSKGERWLNGLKLDSYFNKGKLFCTDSALSFRLLGFQLLQGDWSESTYRA